ncbi:MAG: DNA polymerase, partial [Thermofilaceae archaeon]
LIFFDCETRPKERRPDGKVVHETFLIAASLWRRKGDKYFKVNMYTFQSPKDFTLWLLSKAPCVAFAHNLSYDARAGLDHAVLVNQGWDVKMASFEPRKTFIILVKGKKTVKLVDTMNYYPAALKDLGKTFGLEKLEMPDPGAPPEEWKRYCLRDVEIIETFVTWLLETMWKMGIGFKMTLASYAFALFMVKYKPKWLRFAPAEDPEVRQLEEEAYFGGRVEVFKLGKARSVKVYDVNSMYPFVMRNTAVPIKPVYRCKNMSPALLKAYVQSGQALIAKVKLRIPPETDPPPAPFRDRVTGKVLFPAGEFITVLCTPELQLCIDYVLEVFDVVLYDSHAVFRSYVEDLYSKRLEAKEKGDKAMDLLYKLLLNSLYGKFAERYRRNERIRLRRPGEREGIWLIGGGVVVEAVGPFVIVRKRGERALGRFTAVSAFITSAARAHLYQLMRAVPRSCLLYVDTDSLHVTSPENDGIVPRELIDDKALGKLKLDFEAEEGEYVLPKVYRVGGRVKAKGMPGSHTEIPRKVRVERCLGAREVLRRVGEWVVAWEVAEKEVKAKYDKRLVLPDGSTKPLVLSTIDSYIYLCNGGTPDENRDGGVGAERKGEEAKGGARKVEGSPPARREQAHRSAAPPGRDKQGLRGRTAGSQHDDPLEQGDLRLALLSQVQGGRAPRQDKGEGDRAPENTVRGGG